LEAIASQTIRALEILISTPHAYPEGCKNQKTQKDLIFVNFPVYNLPHCHISKLNLPIFFTFFFFLKKEMSAIPH